MENAHERQDELKIVCAEDCGNAPKKTLLRDFNIAFARCDIDFILEHTTPDIIWQIVGDRIIRGQAQFADVLRQLQNNKATEIRLHNIITHGTTASANGILIFGEKRCAFCDVYRFNSAAKSGKIKTITSYAIDVSHMPAE